MEKRRLDLRHFSSDSTRKIYQSIHGTVTITVLYLIFIAWISNFWMNNEISADTNISSALLSAMQDFDTQRLILFLTKIDNTIQSFWTIVYQSVLRKQPWVTHMYTSAQFCEWEINGRTKTIWVIDHESDDVTQKYHLRKCAKLTRNYTLNRVVGLIPYKYGISGKKIF